MDNTNDHYLVLTHIAICNNDGESMFKAYYPNGIIRKLKTFFVNKIEWI